MKKRIALCLLLSLLLSLALPALAAGDAGGGETPALSSWSKEEVGRAEGYGLLPASPLTVSEGGMSVPVTDWRQPITRAQFVRFALCYAAVMSRCDAGTFQGLVRNLLAEKAENGVSLRLPFTDDRSDEVALAYALGLVEGRGGGIFDPEAPITRQEAATLLYRAYLAVGGEAEPAAEAEPFADEGEIADWALEAVHALRGHDVLRGMGDGQFAPRGSFTVEQCAVCALRLYELMPVSRLRGNAVPRFDREETITGLLGSHRSLALELEGPLASLVVTDFSAMHATMVYYLVYPEGGAEHFSPAVSVWYQDYPMEEPAFSDDGRFLRYTITLDRDLSHFDETTQAPALDYARGVYHAELDVETLRQTVTVTELPATPRWADVPEDAWYYDAAAYCMDLELLPQGADGAFEPDGPVTRRQMVEIFAHAYSALLTGNWSLPLRPENWGEAVIRSEDGRELVTFLAWEKTTWRTWTGPMNKEPWHYSIRASAAELSAAFPGIGETEQAFCEAVLDMGDKLVPGRLGAFMKGDLEDGGPAFLFYPEETSGEKDAGVFESGAPTMLFHCAQPGGEGDSRGIYYFAAKDIFWEEAPEETAEDWYLAWFLYRMWQVGELPEVFRPIYDVTLPEGMDYGQYLEPLFRAGLLPSENENWSFDPAAPVTRALLATVLYRFLEPDAR